VKTDRTILNDNLDVIIHDYKKGSGTLIDAAISGDRNVIKKEAKRL
jgi:DNA modification methylase